MVQALQFTSDFKLGHYMKIPPRPMFFCQVVATVIAGTVQLGVQAWMFSNIREYYSSAVRDWRFTVHFKMNSGHVYDTPERRVSFYRQLTNVGKCDQYEEWFRFICPSTKVFFTASVIWGVIGPKLQFSQGQTY